MLQCQAAHAGTASLGRRQHERWQAYHQTWALLLRSIFKAYAVRQYKHRVCVHDGCCSGRTTVHNLRYCYTNASKLAGKPND